MLLRSARAVLVHRTLLETPFELTCLLTNTSSVEVKLQLTASTTCSSLLVEGLSTLNLGKLRPRASMPVTLRFIAIESGVCQISGFQLLDDLNGIVHEVGTLANIFVHNITRAPPVNDIRGSAASATGSALTPSPPPEI